ncbi:MAG TPA: hypothetical protein VJ843_03580 [Candidatus Saccharimonadales bacterium]|nr:hypothetical protein [Candidatus Saccharimonadales bacterium]
MGASALVPLASMLQKEHPVPGMFLVAVFGVGFVVSAIAVARYGNKKGAEKVLLVSTIVGALGGGAAVWIMIMLLSAIRMQG